MNITELFTTLIGPAFDQVGVIEVEGTITAIRQHRGRWATIDLAQHGADGNPVAKLVVGVPPTVRRPEASLPTTVEPGPAQQHADEQYSVGLCAGAVVSITGVLQAQLLFQPVKFHAHSIAIVSEISIERARLDTFLDAASTHGTIGVNKRRAVPAVINTIVIVGPAAALGAGNNDPARILENEHHTDNPLEIVSLRAPMMGAEAPERLANAIGAAGRRGDVVLICRGGGSASDLAVFDTIPVLQAILDCGVPVITGIGHATDTTTADRIAHTVTPTPTAAAMWVLAQRNKAADAAEKAAHAANVVMVDNHLRQSQAKAEAAEHAQQAATQAGEAARLHRQQTMIIVASVLTGVVAIGVLAALWIVL